ncbi:MAG: ATP cone domain-containing protein [Tissierellaceae bacterium]|nr:ATP cone domain-containing protein [Tissierellaceae bacterium]
MLKVYKRDGRIEDFSQEKLATSLINTGCDIKLTLNQRETELLVQDIENIIISLRGKDGFTSTYEISSIVSDILRNMGYSKLAFTYFENRLR